MKGFLRPVLLSFAAALATLVLTKYLLGDTSPMKHLPRSFIEWCVSIYGPQNAEEVADLELVVAVVISVALTSGIACLVGLSRKWRRTKLS